MKMIRLDPSSIVPQSCAQPRYLCHPWNALQFGKLLPEVAIVLVDVGAAFGSARLGIPAV